MGAEDLVKIIDSALPYSTLQNQISSALRQFFAYLPLLFLQPWTAGHHHSPPE
jgi:hypothetical protein